MSAITLNRERKVSQNKEPRSSKDKLLLWGAATLAVLTVVVTAVVSVLGGSGYQETQPVRTRTKFEPKPAVLLPALDTCNKFTNLPSKGREDVVASDPKYGNMARDCFRMTIRPQDPK